MVGWWLVLFGLSVMIFVDTFFGVGQSFREMASVAILLSLLGLMTRIASNSRRGKRIVVTARVTPLEGELQDSHHTMKRFPQIADKPTPKVPTAV